jgi:integrase/recombinase XerD
MESVALLDCAGRRRSPATLSSFHHGRPPRNKGLRYPPDPTTVEEIIAVMRVAGDSPEGARLRGVIVVLWRAGLRISEALALTESDLDRARGAVTVSAREGRQASRGRDGPLGVGAHRSWLALRTSLPVGALFCVLRGPTRGRPCAPAGIRRQLRATAEAAGVRRRFAPHQLRHANSHPAAEARLSARPAAGVDVVTTPGRHRPHATPRTQSTRNQVRTTDPSLSRAHQRK